MKTSDGYRFGLQFKAASDGHRQVGELMESLGNKKSELVVTAMLEYIRAHPEVLNKDNPVRVIAAYGYSEETLTAKIEEMVRKIAGSESPCAKTSDLPDVGSEDITDKALDIILGGLDQF